MKQTRLVSRGRRTTGNSPGGATSYSLYMYTRVSNMLKNCTSVQSCFTTNLTTHVSKSGISVAAGAFFGVKHNSSILECICLLFEKLPVVTGFMKDLLLTILEILYYCAKQVLIV